MVPNSPPDCSYGMYNFTGKIYKCRGYKIVHMKGRSFIQSKAPERLFITVLMGYKTITLRDLAMLPRKYHVIFYYSRRVMARSYCPNHEVEHDDLSNGIALKHIFNFYYCYRNSIPNSLKPLWLCLRIATAFATPASAVAVSVKFKFQNFLRY